MPTRPAFANSTAQYIIKCSAKALRLHGCQSHAPCTCSHTLPRSHNHSESEVPRIKLENGRVHVLQRTSNLTPKTKAKAQAEGALFIELECVPIRLGVRGEWSPSAGLSSFDQLRLRNIVAVVSLILQKQKLTRWRINKRETVNDCDLHSNACLQPLWSVPDLLFGLGFMRMPE